MERRPWNSLPIHPRTDPLLPLPPALLRLQPHPYRELGAPYGDGGSPFQLRGEVIERLLKAQEAVQKVEPAWRLAIFDGWRPLAVQAFMVQHCVEELCRERGLDPERPGKERDAVVRDVGRFWAPPNPDPAAPPPHSTGAAVDLTLADATGSVVNMGSPIDAIGAVSEPDHFLQMAASCSEAAERELALSFHRSRGVLRTAMEGAGFAQHPGEWWHFSWGDQLWAWLQGEPQARYGRVDGVAGAELPVPRG